MIAQLLRLMVPGTVHQADNFQSANWIDDYNPCTWEGEVGQQACGIRRTNDDLPTVTAVGMGPNNEILPESTLSYMTVPEDFEFPLELEAQLIMFYPPCDSPPGTYKMVVSDEQHEAQTSFEVSPLTQPIIQIKPQWGQPGETFTAYFCGYNSLANQELKVDFMRAFEELDPPWTHKTIQNWIVPIDKNGFAAKSFEYKAGDPLKSFVIKDIERGIGDNLWLLP